MGRREDETTQGFGGMEMVELQHCSNTALFEYSNANISLTFNAALIIDIETHYVNLICIIRMRLISY